MNFSKLSINKGKRLRLLPPASYWEATSERHVQKDDNWLLTDVDSNNSITLTNERTKQRVSLSSDHVHSYTSSPPTDHSFDGYLEVKVTIDITSTEPEINLILSGAARTVQQKSLPPLRIRINALLDNINPKILQAVEAGSTSVSVMIGEDKIRLLKELQKEGGFEEVLSMKSNGNIAIGIGATISGCISDLDDVSTRHGFILHFK